MKRRPPPPGQDDLFGKVPTPRALPPHRHESRTSRAAAVRASRKYSERQLTLVAWMKGRGRDGATHQEIADHFDWLRSSICALVRPLVVDGLLRDAGRERIGKHGAKMIIWLHKDFR